jgi:arylsulfatase A-like enzyme
MPRLAAALGERGSWLTALAVMPTRTNPNHATLLTGVSPAAHGITGNWYWTGKAEREMGDPALLEVETLFTALARQRRELMTVAAFGKSKLRRLLGAAPGRQNGPGRSWQPAEPGDYAASDADAMAGFRALVAAAPPAFGVVALAGVDGAGHRDGPAAPAYAAAVAEADRLVGALVEDLRRLGRWERAVVVVTADHGFDALRREPGAQLDAAASVAPGARFVSDGGVAHVYAGKPGAIEATVALALRHPEIAAVYARTPRPGAPAFPGEWGIDHPRSGDLLLVARPGATFVGGAGDPTRGFRGNHGGPGERRVPFVVVGGHPRLRRAPAGARPAPADFAATAAAVLGVEPPRRLDGGTVDAADRGRVLPWVLGGE